MHDTILLLVTIITVGMLLSNCPVAGQEKLDADAGFWIQITITDQGDSLTASESRQFIGLAPIKTLPFHSVQLPDHKTREIITWEGVYLKEVFQNFLNIGWEKIDRLIIKAPDGYSSVISGMKISQAETALCTFAMQNKDWPKKFGYMRIIFPDLHEMYWMNNPTEVKLILKTEQVRQSTWRFFFFGSPAFHSFQSTTDAKSTGWPLNDILTSMGCANREFAVFTRDGQVREYLFDEIAARMRLAPDSTGWWKIRGERVPIGFRLRKIFFLSSENVGLFTKSLTAEEQLLWQELFASSHPLVNQGLVANEIMLVLASNAKMPSANFEAYRAGNLSLYQLLQMEQDARSDLVAIEVKW